MDNIAIIETFISDKFFDGRKPASRDEALFSNGAVDSLGVLELIAFLEKKFSIRIDTTEHELSEFDTVNLVDQLVNSLQHARG